MSVCALTCDMQIFVKSHRASWSWSEASPVARVRRSIESRAAQPLTHPRCVYLIVFRRVSLLIRGGTSARIVKISS